jgi:hypothetical protein
LSESVCPGLAEDEATSDSPVLVRLKNTWCSKYADNE